MNGHNNDADDADAFVDEMERHSAAIYELVNEYLDAHDIAPPLAVHMLTEMAIQLRMVSYALETERPSATGLKLDLDRFRREIDELLRHAKRGAQEFIGHAATAIAAAESEESEDEESGPEDEGEEP
jgi:hypothetical protein